MKTIYRKINSDFTGYIYRMASSCGHGKVEIHVESEVNGHGCLFGIKIPPFSVKGAGWEGNRELPEKDEVFHVLNYIFKDFNCSERVVEGFNEIKELW